MPVTLVLAAALVLPPAPSPAPPGARLREAVVAHLHGAHCTGIESLYRLRDAAGLSRATAVVGAVGSGDDDGSGLRPGVIAR